MTAIIIEDEKPAARLLQRKLEKLNIPVEVLLHSVRESVVWLSQNPSPDIIFLDIQLSDGLSFEIFDKVNIQSPIIFTTAYDEYALQAFKLNSIDYLLKPIDEEELEVALEKYKNWSKPTAVIDIRSIQQLFNSPQNPEYKKRFSVKVGDHIKIISIEEVELFYSEDKGTYLHTFAGRSFLLDTTLESLEKELDPEKFFRVSRKYIIAHNGIKDIVVYSNSRLKVSLKTFMHSEIIVSRERVNDFKEWLG